MNRLVRRLFTVICFVSSILLVFQMYDSPHFDTRMPSTQLTSSGKSRLPSSESSSTFTMGAVLPRWHDDVFSMLACLLYCPLSARPLTYIWYTHLSTLGFAALFFFSHYVLLFHPYHMTVPLLSFSVLFLAAGATVVVPQCVHFGSVYAEIWRWQKEHATC